MAGFGLPNFGQLTEAFKKAKQIQQDAQKLQDELENMEIEGKSDDEMVKVWISGNQVPLKVEVQENILNANKEQIEQNILQAIQKAHELSTTTMKERMNDLTIISAKLHFEPNGNLEQLIQTTKNNLKLKTETQPYHLPSFGSVFKNPENNYAAKLIDDMGLKGFKIGGAEISTMHSNFIINNSSASSRDIYELITVIQQKVLQKKGIYLQPEVRMIGFDYPN